MQKNEMQSIIKITSPYENPLTNFWDVVLVSMQVDEANSISSVEDPMFMGLKKSQLS